MKIDQKIILPENILKIINILHEHGFLGYVVGGSVRNLIANISSRDFDLTTDATPEQILELFPDSFYDNSFGTVGIKIYGDNFLTKSSIEDKPSEIYEITTFRSESEYSDNRRPDKVTWGKSLLEDLKRRDFTINAIATDGVEIIDPHGGIEDIKNKILRTVGEPDTRFNEDALRLMRAIRIAAQTGFTIEENTFNSISKNHMLLTNISFERKRDEFIKILMSDYRADAIMLLKAVGILNLLLPELNEAFTIEQKSPKRHHVFDVGTHSVLSLKNCPSNNPWVRFATLIHDLGKVQTFKKDSSGLITFFNHEVVGAKIAKNICYRFKLSKFATDKIYSLVRWHQFTVDETQTDSAIRRFIRHVGIENLSDILDLRTGDRLGGGARQTSWRLDLFKKRLEDVQKQPFSIRDLKINGNEIIDLLNISPGPVIGKILNQLFSEVENNTLKNEKEDLLIKTKEIYKTIN